METISITTDFIKLDAFLKFAALCATGGEAKQTVAGGFVSVDGELCQQRGKKLYPGAVVSFGGEEFQISHEG
jgi:ribosome-associated protein